MRAVCAVSVVSVLALSACASGSELAAPPSGPSTSGSAPASASAGSSAPSPADDRTLITLTVAGGEVTGDTGRVRVPLGSTVLLRVTSDVADAVHVHGVDAYVELVPGRQVEQEFVASAPGVFELELHDAGTVLTRMQVQ